MQNIKIIRSNRKTVGIQIMPDLTVVVRAPKSVSVEEINDIVKEKNAWIDRNLKKMAERKKEQSCEEKFSKQEILTMKKNTKKVIPKKVEAFAKTMGVNYKNIFIRCQKTVWGSCSAKGNLNFNCLLTLCPESVVDYVVIHELCHLKEFNHSKVFWEEVKKHCPEFKKSKKWLKEEGRKLINRIK